MECTSHTVILPSSCFGNSHPFCPFLAVWANGYLFCRNSYQCCYQFEHLMAPFPGKESCIPLVSSKVHSISRAWLAEDEGETDCIHNVSVSRAKMHRGRARTSILAPFMTKLTACLWPLCMGTAPCKGSRIPSHWVRVYMSVACKCISTSLHAERAGAPQLVMRGQ